jgi:hypothetical protein
MLKMASIKLNIIEVTDANTIYLVKRLQNTALFDLLIRKKWSTSFYSMLLKVAVRMQLFFYDVQGSLKNLKKKLGFRIFISVVFFCITFRLLI